MEESGNHANLAKPSDLEPTRTAATSWHHLATKPSPKTADGDGSFIQGILQSAVSELTEKPKMTRKTCLSLPDCGERDRGRKVTFDTKTSQN